MRETTPVATDKHGAEVHPSFGMIGASRVSCSPPGKSLFDSEIRHQHYVRLTIQRAHRRRELNHDWIHGDQELIEVAMSEAQWASFVSSMNTSGVSCTIQRYADEIFVPEAPYEPRMAQSVDYAATAADRMYDEVRERLEAVKEKPTKANIRALEHALDAVKPNVTYAAKTLSEHVEDVVTRARADIETMVARHAEQLGIDPAGMTLALTTGKEQDDGGSSD